MKIAYFIDTVIPSQRANTVHVMKMCQAFTQQGHDVTLYCDMDEQKTELQSIWGNYGIINRFNIKRIQVSPFIRKYGHRLANILSAWLKAKGAHHFDIAYGRSAYALYFLRKKGKYIFEVHAEPDKWNAHFEKTILQHSNCIGVVAISEALKRRYLEIFPFVKAENIHVLHDCADIDVSSDNSFAVLRNTRAEDVKIGYIGHIYPGKCMEVLIPLAERKKEYMFHVVGGTDEWINKWKEIIIEKGIQNIIFYGFVNNSDVGKYYRVFDIFLMPFSKKVMLGNKNAMDIGQWISPLKLFEAMSYKKAILSSSLPTIQEVLVDHVDAMLADPDNIDEWAEKLDELVQDSDLRHNLGANAFEKLKRDYTWTERVKKIQRIWEL